MKKILLILTLLVAIPVSAQIVPAQNQLIVSPYGGFLVATSTSGTSKVSATTSPYFSSFRFGNATGTNLYTSTLGLNSEYFTDLTGTGLTNVNGVLTATGDGVSNWFRIGDYLAPSTTVPILIGTTTLPDDLLSADLVRVQSSSSDFIDIGIENSSTHPCATAEFNALNGESSLTTNFSAFGQTGSSFTGSGCANTPYVDFGANATYMLNPNGNVNFALGTSSSNASYRWYGGGYTSTTRLLTLTQPGYLGLGTNAPDAPVTISNAGATTAYTAPQAGTMLHMVSAGSINARAVLDVYNNATAQGGAYQARRARGGIGSPQPPNADDTLFLIGGNGYGTSAFPAVSTVGIVGRAETSGFTNTSQPTYLAMLTSPTGTISPTERMRITSAGLVGIGSTSPSRLLTVAGDAIFANTFATGTASSTRASTTALTVYGNAWLNLASSTGLTATNLFSTNATSSTSFFSALGTFTNAVINGVLRLVGSANPTVDESGELAYNTALQSLSFATSTTGLELPLYPPFKFTIASSSWTGTSTEMGYPTPPNFDELITTGICWANGSGRIVIGNGTATSTPVTLSAGTTSVAIQRRFNKNGTMVNVHVGTPTTLSQVKCTFERVYLR